MVPGSEPSHHEPPDDGTSPTVADIEQAELYYLVRRAVEDAILGVLGTLLLVGIGFVLVWFGVVVAASGGDASAARVAGGVLVAAVGFYLAASSLGVVPSVSDLV